MSGFLIYEIKTGDTLQSIGESKGLSAGEVLDFHNQNCGRAGLLWINSLTGIKRILLPAKVENPVETRKVREQFFPGKFSAEFYSSQYAVSETFVDQDKGQMEITYGISLNFFVKEKPEGKFQIAEISKTNFKKNGNEPDDKISTLSLDCMTAVSPLSFIISENGKLEKLFEFENISERFQLKKDDIQEFHIGEAAEHFIAQFEKNISDENSLLKKLNAGFDNQILFPGFRMFHQEEQYEKSFSPVPNSFPVRFLFQNQFSFENKSFAEIKISGKIIENCTLQEVLLGIRYEDGVSPEDYISGNIEINYLVDKNTSQLKEVTAKTILNSDDDIYSEHHLKITNYG